MDHRINYRTASPEGYQAFGRVSQYVKTCGLDPALIDLVWLRISQINGCAYCVDLHYRDALKAGVDPRKINSTITWREAPFFTEREQAALAWAESLTNLPATGAPDADYQPLLGLFNEKEIADLTYAIALMNAFNRLSVGFRQQPSLS